MTESQVKPEISASRRARIEPTSGMAGPTDYTAVGRVEFNLQTVTLPRLLPELKLTLYALITLIWPSKNFYSIAT